MVLALALGLLLSQPPPQPQMAPTPPPITAQPPSAPAASPGIDHAALDALFVQRDDPAKLAELEARLTQAVKDNPRDYGVLWRAAQLKFWQADGAGDKPERKKQLGKEGWALGDRAREVNPKGAEGHYFAGVSVGMYSEAVGIVNALFEGIEGKFNERVDAAVKLGPWLDMGAPLLAKGRYHFSLPWPKRDLKKALQLFEQVTAKEPKNLHAWMYLAEAQLAEGKKKEAQQSIQRALQGSVDYDPPAARRAQERAKVVAAQIERELK